MLVVSSKGRETGNRHNQVDMHVSVHDQSEFLTPKSPCNCATLPDFLPSFSGVYRQHTQTNTHTRTQTHTHSRRAVEDSVGPGFEVRCVVAGPWLWRLGPLALHQAIKRLTSCRQKRKQVAQYSIGIPVPLITKTEVDFPGKLIP